MRWLMTHLHPKALLGKTKRGVLNKLAGCNHARDALALVAPLRAGAAENAVASEM
eukprot:GDKH01016567.1.p3 GENE.GDKH01016567.1~~GDKH01016567.1.p3  ORF type:complete len:55 (+),score=5.50 GDKH01016567.1:343-507(+)